MTFGERLVHYRMKKKLTQKALAENLGITPTRLNYWEKDKRQPDVEMIRLLSSVLDVSADILIGYKEDPETKKAPAPEGAEEDEKVQMVVQGLTRLLVEAGWIAPGADLSDAQLRTLASYVIGLSAYFNSDL